MKKQIEALTPEMLEKLARLVRYNSIKGEAKDDMPFGEETAKCLKEALQICEEMGFETKNVDNYCGYAQMGEGKDIIGIIAHLDIVPAGDDWSTDPFEMTIKGDTVYGRGVSDDKGAAIASLYAMKLIKDSGIKLNKRIRLLMGCNEETGSACMQYYNKHEEPITLGFTPDGEFPGIHGEKGGCSMLASSKNTRIIAMNGGFVSNAVCNRCTTVVPAKDVNIDKLKEALSKTALLEYSVNENNGEVTIDARGVAAHASTPLLGVNAAGCTMQALADCGFEDDFVKFYNSHIGTKCNGEGINLNISDDYGVLTFNNGIVKTENGKITCTIDIRVPVTFTEKDVRERTAGHLEDENGKIEILHVGNPLFYPVDSPLVSKLYNAYVQVTGDTVNKPSVIGGGTYAKYIPNSIAFGCEFPGNESHIHDADERLKITDLQKQVEIYVQAIRNLLAD